MKRWALAVTFLALATLSASAQTTYNLTGTIVDYIPYGTYANLFADDMSGVTIDGVPYYTNITAHTDATGTCASSCFVTFQNLNTGEEIPVPYTGKFSTTASKQPTVLTGTFTGAFNGSFTLDIFPVMPKPPCGRFGCHLYYVQVGSTLTLQ